MLGPAEDEEDGRDERGVGEEEEDDEDKSEEDSEVKYCTAYCKC